MGNRAGRHYGLTILSPVRDDPDRCPSHVSELRDYLESLPVDSADSPLARVPNTHFARWVVVEDVVFEGLPAREDHLHSAYLLFTSNFDGEFEPYIDGMLDNIPEVLEAVWGHCYGFPGTSSRLKFRHYFRQCQLRTSFLFSDYSEASLGNVLRARQYQKEFLTFVLQWQHGNHGSAELWSAFDQFMIAMRRTPLPPPGAA